MRDMISTTAIAEYTDMLFNRLAIEFGKPEFEHVVNWWIELHPPDRIFGMSEEQDQGVGTVRLRAWTNHETGSKRVNYTAYMHAVQQGAKCSVEVLEHVVEHHVSDFARAVAA